MPSVTAGKKLKTREMSARDGGGSVGSSEWKMGRGRMGGLETKTKGPRV